MREKMVKNPVEVAAHSGHGVRLEDGAVTRGPEQITEEHGEILGRGRDVAPAAPNRS